MAQQNDDKNNSVITLTFGEQAENHTGMQILGSGLASKGLQLNQLRQAKKLFENKPCLFDSDKGFICNYYRLDKKQRSDIKEKHDVDLERASILVIRNGVKALGVNADDVFLEQKNLVWDKKAFMYGRVVNKKARYNLCYGNESQTANYEEKKGTVIAWDNIPLTKKIRENIPQFFGDKTNLLQGEGNLYYDILKCGLSWHGDTERKIVIAIRLGESMPLYFQWYYNNKRIGEKIKIVLNHGDVYAMSEKATGHDWKRKKIATLRHATGCDKFIK